MDSLFLIRILEQSDLEEALRLVWKVFEEFEAPFYSEEGNQEFKNFIELSSILEKYRNGNMKLWGCFDENLMIGVIATRAQKHICLLFVKKEYHQQGIARNLFLTALKDCQMNTKTKWITVNSSPYAIGFYCKIGFTKICEEQKLNGILYTPMKYKVRGDTSI